MTNIIDQPTPSSAEIKRTTIGDTEVVWEVTDYGAEYDALRTGAGLIDSSAGGPIRVSGADAIDALQEAITRDVEFLVPDRAQTSLMLRCDGAVVDVVTVV